MTTFSAQIAASADDASEHNDGSMDLTAPEIRNNATYIYNIVRFQLTGVQQGATIASGATLSVYVGDATYDDPDVTIYGDDADNSAQPTTGTNDISNRTATTASVSWQATGIGTGWQTTPDISSIIQEIVDRPGFVAGNYISLIFARVADTIRWTAYDDTPGNAAQLDFDYTLPTLPGGRFISLNDDLRIFGRSAGPGTSGGTPGPGAGELPPPGINGLGFKGFALPDQQWTLGTMTASALTTLLATAQAAGGGTVIVPAGSISGITTGILFPALECNIYLVADGTVTLTAGAGLNTNIFRIVSGASNIAIDGFTINGNSVIGSIRGISFGTGSSNLLAQNITVYDCNNSGITVTQSEKVTVRNCLSYNHTDGHCYTMGGSENAVNITNDFSFYNNEGYGIPSNGKYGLDVHGYNGIVKDNNLHDCDRVFKCPDAQDVLFEGNTFSLADGGLFVGRASDDYNVGGTHVTFSGNSFVNPSSSPTATQYAFKYNNSSCAPCQVTFDDNTYTGFLAPQIANGSAVVCNVTAGSNEDTNKATFFTNPGSVTTI